MNYKLGENKYNYEIIKDMEKELKKKEEKLNQKAKISIDEKWKLANIKKPDIFEFFEPEN